MIFDKVEVEQKDDGYEVILHIKPNNSLEEFAEEFGFSKKAVDDINRAAIGYVKKKFSTLRVRNIKVMMGGAVVTSIMFGGGMTQAFANEHEGEVQAETETVTDNATTETNTEAGVDATTPEETPEPDVPAPEESSPMDEGTDPSPVEEEPTAGPTPEEPIDDNTATEIVAMDEPGLVPGDFFYFVEAIAEKVQLALTFDDTAKAELISQFANERIAEANALFEAGDTEGALDLLNQALENQELALDYVTEEKGEAPPEEDLTSPEGDLPPEAIEGEPDPTEDGDAVQGDETAEKDPASEVRDELQTQFSQNITALLLAMEKVGNPKAKAALARNVEKAYAKMEKKLGKMKDIEERIATAIPVDEEVEDLRTAIRNDQEDFESDMAEVEGEATGVVPPVAPKKAQEKAQNGQEKAQAGQQKAQEKASTGQEKQAEKRATTPAPKNETKVNTTPAGEKAKGNTNTNVNAGAKAGGNGNGKAKVETEVNADVEAGAEVTPSPKENERAKGSEGKGNQGKGNGKNNE